MGGGVDVPKAPDYQSYSLEQLENMQQLQTKMGGLVDPGARSALRTALTRKRAARDIQQKRIQTLRRREGVGGLTAAPDTDQQQQQLG